MVDTNALLSIAFSLIANFTNVVEIPPDQVPQSPADLSLCIIGSPMYPTDVILVHTNGTRFTINHSGGVNGYASPDSFFRLQDVKDLSRYSGEPKLNSNEVLRLATKTLQRLVKSGNPLTNGTPRIQQAGEFHGKRIPFFRITWPSPPGSYGSSTIASIEIDARTGKIVNLHLYDIGFLDAALGNKIMDRVYTPDPKPPAKPPGKRIVPYPTTNQVTQAIENWLVFCRRLNLNPGGDTNVSQVDWDRTYAYTNSRISTNMPVCQIRFKNNACFEALDGRVYCYFCPDACFTGFWEHRPEAEMKAFVGPKKISRTEVTGTFDHFLSTELGIPLATFTNCRKVSRVGGEGLKRVVLDWVKWPPPKDFTDPYDLPKLFSVEFDLETGEVKWIFFDDLGLIAALRQTQPKPPIPPDSPAQK
jgi:hypothetical protein